MKPAGLCKMPSVMLLSFFLSKGTLTSWTAAASAEFLEPELKHPTCVTCTPSHLHWFALRTKCHTAGHVIALWSSPQWTGRCPIEAAQGKFRTAFISWSNLDKWERGDGREVDGCIVLSFLSTDSFMIVIPTHDHEKNHCGSKNLPAKLPAISHYSFLEAVPTWQHIPLQRLTFSSLSPF